MLIKFIFSFVVLLLSLTRLWSQDIPEKDILLTEYPPYNDILMNELIESHLTDGFMKKNRVKILTNMLQYSDNKSDTILPVQKLYYDTLGRISQREVFYYGGLYFTEFFSYSGNKMTVHNKRFSNHNREKLGYEVFYDNQKNPVKFVSYDPDYHPDGLDSIIFSYTYGMKGEMLSKKEILYYDEGETNIITFSFKYNPTGQNITYKACNSLKQSYSVIKKYEYNLMVQKVGMLHLFPTDDLKRTKEKFFDSTFYYYYADSSIALMKRDYLYDPLSDYRSQSVIQFVYDEKGFLKEKFDLADPKRNHAYYRWEFYNNQGGTLKGY